jgi:hypothetical protein
MNRKQLITLIVLVVVIGGAGWYFFKRQNNAYMHTEQKLGQKLFADLPVNDVAQIEIKQNGADLTLVKKDDLWRVKERNDYPANFTQISDFLVKAKDLKIAQSEEIGASQFPKLELLEPSKGAGSGTLLNLKDKSGKAIQSAILGKKVMRKSERPSQFGDDGFPVGRYISLPSDSKHVFVISDSLNEIEAKPENWLNKDFFKVEKVKSVSLVSTNATNSWKLTRTNETGPWVLADAKPSEHLDTNKVSGVANTMSSPSFTDVVVDAKPEKTGLDKPTTVTMETFDGFTYTLKLGKGSGDNYNLTMAVSADFPKERVAGKDEKPEDKTKLDKEFADKTKKLEEKLKREKAFEKWTYEIAKWTVDPLLRDRGQLMVEKKEEPKVTTKTPKAGQFFDPTGLEK